MPAAFELRELEDEELEGRLTEYRRELLNLRFQLATGQLDNVTRVSQVRRDVARVLTVLRDREIAVAEGRDAGPVISTRPARRPRPERVEPEVEVEVEPEVEVAPGAEVAPENEVGAEAEATGEAVPQTDARPTRRGRGTRRSATKATAEAAVDEEDR